MGDECQPTYAVTPMIHLKNEARSCLSSLSLRNVIICDNNTSLAANIHTRFNILYSSYSYCVIKVENIKYYDSYLALHDIYSVSQRVFMIV
jgi:hypothetical protein